MNNSDYNIFKVVEWDFVWRRRAVNLFTHLFFKFWKIHVCSILGAFKPDAAKLPKTELRCCEYIIILFKQEDSKCEN